MVVYRCEDSIESIFTAVYLAYEHKKKREEVYLALHDDPVLFSEDIYVIPDKIKTIKVMNTLQKRFGEEDYRSLCKALASEDPEKAQAVYGTIYHGLEVNCKPGHLLEQLTDDDILKTFQLARNSGREIQHLMGFLRFQETEGKLLYAKIGPKNNILTFLMPHFADRLPMENFVVYDDIRDFFGIHPAGKQWYLYRSGEGKEPILRLTEDEIRYRELFQHFCQSIAIKARENSKLQMQMCPLRFQKYMMEFDSL